MPQFLEKDYYWREDKEEALTEAYPNFASKRRPTMPKRKTVKSQKPKVRKQKPKMKPTRPTSTTAVRG